MKILITGSGGMLGSDLAERFKDKFETIGLGRRAKPDYLSIPYVQCDLGDKDSLSNLLKKEKPKLIFHAAAMTRVDDCETHRNEAFRDNVEITRNLIEANQSINALIVFFSTDYVFDGKKSGEYEEDDEKKPLNVYGETKHLAEESLREKAKHFVIFRTSWLYGVRGKSFPRTMLNLAKNQDVLKIVSDQKGRPTYTKDIAESLFWLIERKPKALSQVSGETFHLVNDGVASWAEFAMTLFREAGCTTTKVEFILSKDWKQGAIRPKNSVLSLKKTERQLGIKMRPWTEAVREFIQILKHSEGIATHG